MQKHTITYLPVFPENPGNPARCEVATGKIEINRQIWDLLPVEQRKYVLEHEKGHYYRQTFDEVEADAYALEQLALKKKNSLWNYVVSVRNISHGDTRRVRAAEKAALEVAAKHGSADAQRLLLRYYANASGPSIEAGRIQLPVEINIPWYVFAWVILLVVTTCILIAKFK